MSVRGAVEDIVLIARAFPGVDLTEEQWAHFRKATEQQLEKMLVLRSADPELIERVAEAIYRNAVSEPDDLAFYQAATGRDQPKVWKTSAPWDTNPDELTEHERDDFRRMARAALGVR